MNPLVYLPPEKVEQFTEADQIVSETFCDNSLDIISKNLSRVETLLSRIPPRESVMIHLYYYEGKSQSQIASILNVTQGDVSYKLKKGRFRIRLLLEFPLIDEDGMQRDLAIILPKENPRDPVLLGGDLYLKVMMGMYRTTCQTAVGRELNIVQGRVRHRFVKGMKILKVFAQRDPDVYSDYLKAFNMIIRNGNMLKELKQYSDYLDNNSYKENASEKNLKKVTSK